MVALAVIASGCAGKATVKSEQGVPIDGGATSKTTTQKQKEAPAEGTGNVQGTVFYNDAPVAGINVTLCQSFSRFVGGCSGDQFEATTADDGVFVVADVTPGEYEGLLVSVFDTGEVQFATSGIVNAKTYSVKAGKTLFVDPTHLYRTDLAVTGPPAGSQVSAEGLAITWDAYPDAAYYELSLQSEDVGTPSPVTGQRVDATTFSPPKRLVSGSYRIMVSAFNAKGRQLAENASGYVITVTG